jgi:hypothetical protein
MKLNEKIEKEFKETWDVILHEVLSDPKFNDIRSSISWLQKVVEKNVPHGTHKRYILRFSRPALSKFWNFWFAEVIFTYSSTGSLSQTVLRKTIF